MEFVNKACSSMAAWWRTRTVTVAVTGLSRSGKTAFITSVIANLEAASGNAAAARWLHGLDVVDTLRLHSARRPLDYRPTHDRMFDYPQMLLELTADKPEWPSRTANIYETALDIHFWPGQPSKSTDAPTARLRLVFVDYPGEWLADIPLLGQSYVEWSKTALNRLQRTPWSDVSVEFRNFLKATQWGEHNDNGLAQIAALKWQEVLLVARNRGLKWVQPGHFVRQPDQPDEQAKPQLAQASLWFCPLPEAEIKAAKRGSLAYAMAGRYAAYQKRVGTFFRDTLKDASRHVLLVDVLEALAEGESAFHETAEVLAAVYQVFADQNSGFWRIFSRAGFDRVLMLATKADTVPRDQRETLASLLAQMCRGQLVGVPRIAPPRVNYIASIRATEDVERTMENGDTVRVVQGVCSEEGVRRRVCKIDIPKAMPTPEYFRRRQGIRTPRFLPPKVEGLGHVGIPNIRLGMALDNLLEDLLQ